MGRRAKPVNPKAGKSLNERLAESLLREKATGALLQEKTRSLAEVLEQQTATSEILRVISSSPTDVQPVFDAIVRNASRLCATPMAVLIRVSGDVVHLMAHQGTTPEWEQAARHSYPQALSPSKIGGLAIIARQIVHVPDLEADDRFADARRLAQTMGYRSVVFVPMLREGVPIGAIGLTRSEPFTEVQIKLLQTFAEQAVIAIENVRLFTELQARNHDLTETLEQQKATSEILRVISQSPTDVQPVFDTIVRNAVRLCEGIYGQLFRLDGESIHLVAQDIPPDRAEEWLRWFPRPLASGGEVGRVITAGAVRRLADVEADHDAEFSPVGRAMMRDLGTRSLLMVPMFRRGLAIGVIVVTHREVGAFADVHVELLKTFADQAVIAIENVRLFEELEARNRDLTETLEQQTATAEILRVISSSPTDVQPVFETIARSVALLCNGLYTYLSLFDGEILTFVAFHNVSPAALEILRRRFPSPPTRGSSTGRAILDRAVVHIPDVSVDAEYQFSDLAQADAYRSILAVPMLREGIPIGAITVGRQAAFRESQIALVETFADQAVIAIENVRLFTELQRRNADVTATLEQQKATNEILRIISQSPTDVQPVFDAIVRSAQRLLGAYSCAAMRRIGDEVHLAAHTTTGDAGDAALTSIFPISIADLAERFPDVERVWMDGDVLHHPDIELGFQDSEHSRLARARGFRARLHVPMRREGLVIGDLSVTRREPGPFATAEIALLQTFADQAVIAIENVRLFTELEARTQDLTRSVGELRALGEVGQAISSTLDLQTVLSTIVARATQLSGTDAGVIYEYDEEREVFVPRATAHLEAEIVETMLAAPVRKGEGATGQLAEVLAPIQLPNILEAPTESRVRDVLVRAGYRALLAVPLVREDYLIGGLTVIRKATGEFAPEVIDLMRTFATQSALAIQNARLFLEIDDKSRQLETASQHKSEFLANMSHELRTPLNAIIGFSEVLAEGMFGEINDKQDEYLRDILESGRHLLSLINDILDLSKIEAGRMDLESTDFDLPGAIDNALALVRERAGRRGIALGRAIDEGMGVIRADERKVKQVLLNLLSNAIKFTPEGGRIDVRAAVNGGLVEVSVADTGVGIAPEDQEAVFEEFRQVGTSEKKVEGTGLGLALSRKFIDLHGGRIWVKSQVGQGSTFTFTLPVRRGE